VKFSQKEKRKQVYSKIAPKKTDLSNIFSRRKFAKLLNLPEKKPPICSLKTIIYLLEIVTMPTILSTCAHVA
jgi:hypothetical protein